PTERLLPKGLYRFKVTRAERVLLLQPPHPKCTHYGHLKLEVIAGEYKGRHLWYTYIPDKSELSARLARQAGLPTDLTQVKAVIGRVFNGTVGVHTTYEYQRNTV